MGPNPTSFFSRPHVMYTVPTGQNPTSATLTLERAEAVYRVAQKHDIIIVEDDPYFWLVMDPYTGPASDNKQSTPLEEGRVQLKDVRSLDDFAKSLPRSYLSIDTDGRVLRLDSFSKCFARKSRIVSFHPHKRRLLGKSSRSPADRGGLILCPLLHLQLV